MIKLPPYLLRHQARVATTELKRQIVFGLILGTITLLVSAVQYFLVINANDDLWIILMYGGGFIIAGSVAFPSAWDLPERAWRKATNQVGHALFLGLLTVIYLGMIWPIGWFIRRRHGTDPIYQWNGTPPARGGGWCDKSSRVITGSPLGRQPRPFLLQPFGVVTFFYRNGNYFVLPVVILLLVVGLIMFFVHTSVLAPFIYTLF